ncbi:MAG: hypothetical protein LBG04_00090 [Holosporaceae bacterium]|jgi:hypothetical protein|nr:hypothetical protein [Holosporaceae bacterium]
MNRKTSLCIVFGLGFFSTSTFGRPEQSVIDQVQQLEMSINSGNLDVEEETIKKVDLLKTAEQNFDILPAGIKSLFGLSPSNKTKKLVALNILRLYAFPNDPTEIGTALDNLIYRCGTKIFKQDQELKQFLFREIINLDVDAEMILHFKKIINIQKIDYGVNTDL